MSNERKQLLGVLEEQHKNISPIIFLIITMIGVAGIVLLYTRNNIYWLLVGVWGIFTCGYLLGKKHYYQND